METKRPFVAYLRVSTAQQGRSGLGLEAQSAAVIQFVSGRGGELIAPNFVEVESGNKNARPELEKALKQCRLTGATLVVAKLDRLSRNAAFLMTLRDSGIQFVAADLPEANTMTVGVMAVVAQHEREAISARTRAALAAAKTNGRSLGGRRKGAPDISQYRQSALATLRTKADERAELRREALERALAESTTLSGIATSLNYQRVTTSRGKGWTPIAASRLMKRLNLALTKK